MNNMKERIEELIKDLLVSHDEEETEGAKTETVDEYLKYIDSIRFIELITAMETEFGIEIASADLVKDNLTDLDAFVNMMAKYVK